MMMVSARMHAMDLNAKLHSYTTYYADGTFVVTCFKNRRPGIRGIKISFYEHRKSLNFQKDKRDIIHKD